MEGSTRNRMINAVLLVLRVLLALLVVLIPAALIVGLTILLMNGQNTAGDRADTAVIIGLFVLIPVTAAMRRAWRRVTEKWNPLTHTVHDWNGCQCRVCGIRRPEAHQSHVWNGCTCTVCGMKREKEHDWDHCRCRICGKARDEAHDWDHCRCRVCGKTRDAEHDWDGCRCRVCGETRDEGHDWDGCRCRVCGKIRDEGHDWDGCKCRKCGSTRDEGHDWDATHCVCKRCGREDHEWVYDHDYEEWDLPEGVPGGLENMCLMEPVGAVKVYRCKKCGAYQ